MHLYAHMLRGRALYLWKLFALQDGQIDYGEFAAMMRKGNGGVGRRTMRGNFNLGEALGVLGTGSGI